MLIQSTYGFLAAFLPALSSLLVLPMLLAEIGAARLGVMTVALLLVGYLGFLDLGVSKAVAQRVALLRANRVGARGALLGGLGITVSSGLFAGVVVLAICFVGLQSYTNATLTREELLGALGWMLPLTVFTFLFNWWEGVLIGYARFKPLAVTNLIQGVLLQVVPLWCVHVYGARLTVLLAAVVMVRLLVLLCSVATLVRRLNWRGRTVAACLEARNLLRYGKWVALTGLVSPLMVVTDRFLIGALVGPSAVTLYNVPFQLAERLTLVSSALGGVLMNRLAGGAEGQVNQLFAWALRVQSAVLLPVSVAGLALVEPFLIWWVGDGFSGAAAMVAQVLMLGFFVNAMAYLPYVGLYAEARPDAVAKIHLIELVPYLLCLVFFLLQGGVVAASLVFVFRAFVDLVLLSWRFGRWRPVWTTLLVPIGLLLLTLAVSVGWVASSHRSVCLTVMFAGAVTWSLMLVRGDLRQAWSRYSAVA